MECSFLFPEIRQHQPIWLIGRILAPADDLPRYLGLHGPKPLLGWDQASRDPRGVCVVEGPLDLLASIGTSGSRVISVQLPPGIKDPADLARLANGSVVLRDAIRQACDGHIWP